MAILRALTHGAGRRAWLAKWPRSTPPVIQIDEADLTGHPQDGVWAFEPINRRLDAVHGERGPSPLLWQLWRPNHPAWRMAATCLPSSTQLHVDHLVLEFRAAWLRRVADSSVSCVMRSSLGVGVIDIKDNEVETPEEVARRIEQAVKVLGAERIAGCIRIAAFGCCRAAWRTARWRHLVQGRNLFQGQGQVSVHDPKVAISLPVHSPSVSQSKSCPMLLPHRGCSLPLTLLWTMQVDAAAQAVAPACREQGAGHQFGNGLPIFLVVVHDAVGFGQREVRIGAFEQVQGIARLDDALLEDTEIPAGVARVLHLQGQVCDLPAASELPTGLARLRELHNHLLAPVSPVCALPTAKVSPIQELRFLQAERGEVLAKRT